MKLTRTSVASVAALCTLGLVGGGAVVVSPASASAGVNWGHIWKTQIKPRADKRYYTKKKANSLFSVKSALLNYYTKTETDAKYATPTSVGAALGNYYTKAQSDTNYYSKAQSDAKYAPYPSVVRGTWDATGAATAAGQYLTSSISYGVTLSASPTVHYINLGAPVPAGCSGTPQAPNATPGNLCVFEDLIANATSRGTYDPANNTTFATSNPMGITVYATSTAAGQVFALGTWALRPVALSASKVPASVGHSGARAAH